MSDKERYKNDQNDENNDSSSTTTTTVNSNRANSSIINPDSNHQQQIIQNKQKKKGTSLPKSNMEHRFEIQHLSDDHDFDDEFNDDYDNGAMLPQSIRIDDLDARGIIEYFDDTEMQPISSKNMFVSFNSQVHDKINLRNESIEFKDDNDKIIDTKFNRISSLNEKNNSTKQVSPIMLLRRESMRRSINRAKSSNELKRTQKSDSFKIQAEKSDDNSESDQPEAENEFKKEIKNKKQRFLSADHLYNKRLAKQKEKEMEDAYQKKIKNLSKKQIQEQQHFHQYPHPTQQQRNLQQKHLTLMFTPENERHNLYNRTSSLSTNLQTTSGYIIGKKKFKLDFKIIFHK